MISSLEKSIPRSFLISIQCKNASLHNIAPLAKTRNIYLLIQPILVLIGEERKTREKFLAVPFCFKPELTTLEACHRLALGEGQKENKRREKEVIQK